MLAPVSRIALRYAAAALVTWGVLSPSIGGQIAADKDVLGLVEIGIGVGVAAAVEGWYWLAQKFGWAK